MNKSKAERYHQTMTKEIRTNEGAQPKEGWRVLMKN
jgi:hypothetical protein